MFVSYAIVWTINTKLIYGLAYSIISFRPIRPIYPKSTYLPTVCCELQISPESLQPVNLLVCLKTQSLVLLIFKRARNSVLVESLPLFLLWQDYQEKQLLMDLDLSLLGLLQSFLRPVSVLNLYPHHQHDPAHLYRGDRQNIKGEIQ